MAEARDNMTLRMEIHAYKKIALTLRDHKNMLYRLKMNDLIKKDLMRDMDIIQRILEASEVKDG
ncbi:MAG TPA: hypothetical protein PLV52_00460 [Candidatus Omnitrophota bacterium]|nr:hypothetical protein [Candidatus Omnitrophota bacterium]